MQRPPGNLKICAPLAHHSLLHSQCGITGGSAATIIAVEEFTVILGGRVAIPNVSGV